MNMANEGTGVKREYRIDSSDAARPAATLEAEPRYFAQGLKPKTRTPVSVVYEELDGEFVERGKHQPPAKLVLKTVTYDDGSTRDCTVGEDNRDYMEYKAGRYNIEKGGSTSTRKRQPKAKAPKAAKKGS
jgi:hypothetical protein